MCGIAGLFSFRSLSPTAQEWVTRMAEAIANRGPDDSGSWVDQEKGVAFGHRRLAVIDLSMEGHQPMFSESGRYVLNYNGEIYNYAELKRELSASGHRFRGHSDTEVMLAAFEQWGFERAISRFTGMFAFALWDRQQEALILARDRMGEKPLYYGLAGDSLLFASELKAFRQFPDWKPEIDRGALCLLLRHCYIGAPHSIYKGIRKLIPGTFLVLRRSNLGELPEPVYYWSPHAEAEKASSEPFLGTDAEAIAQLEDLLKKTITGQMIADVPLGAFLSGGIDSSTVVALMQAQANRPVRTFTIGFHETEFNEATYAAAVAKHLGTDHTEFYVTPEESLSVISRLPELYDEPFADFSQIPTYLVSRLAREHVTVSLSGDGGDELFAGYNRYFRATNLWNGTKRLPSFAKHLGSAAIRAFSPRSWNKLLRPFRALMPADIQDSSYGNKAYKLAEILEYSNFMNLYRSLLSHWQYPALLVPGSVESSTPLTDPARQAALPGLFEQMMFLDAVFYLPDDILTKVDRASMAVSLESRVPMLDHRLVEFAWRLPLSMKIRNGKRKWILLEILKKYLPLHLVDRPKQGFSVPLETWLRGPLRDWAEALLDENRLKREGFFNSTPIRDKWAEHLSGKRDCHYQLWNILMFQAWLEANRA